ncbi:hypothetical protein SAY86_018577 [Trapa natans]|uniref:Uncharacterized protein n=1 Tax=Trapa natans TaxID=22666 RepID=A0AAN7LGI3_TRANT|nr:hypothetical protein SAY86_018577 [Trapa natans]
MLHYMKTAKDVSHSPVWPLKAATRVRRELFLDLEQPGEIHEQLHGFTVPIFASNNKRCFSISIKTKRLPCAYLQEQPQYAHMATIAGLVDWSIELRVSQGDHAWVQLNDLLHQLGVAKLRCQVQRSIM